MYIGHLVLLVQCVLPDVHWSSCIACAVCTARCTLVILYCLCIVYCQMYIGYVVLLVQCVVPDVHCLCCSTYVVCAFRYTSLMWYFLCDVCHQMYIDPKNPRHAREEAGTLLLLSDTDHDGSLSLREIFNKMDLFLGSKMVDTAGSFHDEF